MLELAHGMTTRRRKLWGGQHDGRTVAEWAREQFGWGLAVIRRPAGVEGFEALPGRWMIGPTFGRLRWYHWLSKYYEVLAGVSEAIIYAAMIHILIRSLAI
ncbi:MAG: hypothetical protein U0531_00985 [Dehalococcoidia bacterium]